MIDIMIMFAGMLMLGGLTRWLYKMQTTGNKKLFSLALIVKVLAGISVGLIYFNYYHGGGDTISYWHDGKLIAEGVWGEPARALGFFWSASPDPEFIPGLFNEMPRSFFFSKICGVLALVSSGNYWVMATILSFIAFLSAWYLFLSMVEFIPEARWPAAIAFLLFPSIVFWSSGLIKESIGLASLYLISGLLLKAIGNSRIRKWEWACALLALWLGWNLKYYWMGVFLPITVAVWAVSLLSKMKPRFARYDLLIGLGFLSVLLVAATHIHPNFYPHRFLEVVFQNNLEFMALSDPVNTVQYHDLRPSWTSVLFNSPQAVVAGFFRPFAWEVHNVLSGLAGLENMAVFILVLAALPGLRNVKNSPFRLLIMGTLTYCFMLAIFLALSTPNLGTLARYKIGFMPYLIFLCLYRNPLLAWFTRRYSLGQ